MARTASALPCVLSCALAASVAAGCSSSSEGGGPRTQNDAGASSDSGSSSGSSSGGLGPDSGPFYADGGLPGGWLYTSGSQIYVSNGGGQGTPWMGRGVNIDDIYLCGFNNMLQTASPDRILQTMVSGLMSGWKPNFIRISLGMASYPTVSSWTSNPAPYKTPMTSVIHAIGANPNVYVLVTLRSDASMIGQDTADGDPEATGLPSDSTTTPNATMYPTGTDATYIALVDSFATDSFVLFGLTNEPGGNKLPSSQIASAMSHAVGVIRAEEDRLGVPHHLVSVQGNGWTSDISYYKTNPLTYDNVVYEVHGYPPAATSYTYANLPVILGEYGSLPDAAAFYADLEAKKIPNLAWDFDPYSNCAPDLVNVTGSATNPMPSPWGMTVQSYLLAHAQ